MPDHTSDTCVHVALKEFVESKLEAQKELFRSELKGRDDALKLQAEEYKRRLDDLNHAHERSQERNSEFIRLDKFDALEREFRMYKESNDKAVDNKAKAAADAVDSKATALKREFDEYKATQATATNLAAGAKQGLSKMGALGITIVGVIASVLWAISTGINIYITMHPH